MDPILSWLQCRGNLEQLLRGIGYFLHGQAIAYVADLNRVALDAADGTVLDACERLALDKGRSLLRTTMAAALEGRIAATEEKGGPLVSAPRRTPSAPRVGTGEPF